MTITNNSFILKNDGTLWGCGYNGEGQLGLGDTTNKSTFTQVTTNVNNIKSIHRDLSHTFILKNDGTLWGCGYNGGDQLNLGNTTNIDTIVQITANTNDIKSFYCGAYHTFILKNDGTLWGSGHNGSGQLGLEDTSNKTTFTIIGINTGNIKSVYCGDGHTFILKNDGTLWGCGANNAGQLGLGDKTNRTTFTQITTNVSDVKSIYCGNQYTIMLKNDGTLWGCGWNQCGQLGLGDNTARTTFTQITTNVSDVKSIYCGNQHTIMLKNDGTLWGSGLNHVGQLGLGNKNNRNKFTQITTNVDDIKSIYCGFNNLLMLKNDGTLWGCGDNQYGQLGLGDTTSRTTFTQVTTNTDDIKSFADDYSDIPSTTKIYDLKIGYVETLDTNNFRNIPVDTFEKIKVLYTNPVDTYLNCLVSFDQKQTWKTFDGLNWNTISDISPENIILNGMELIKINQLDKNKLISGGFTGDLDFRIAMKTNDKTVTSSVTKIYIEYK